MCSVSSFPHFPLLQLLVAFGAISFTFVIFRLSSFNTFIDHRKTVLRGVFREVCEAYPDLLLLIQNIANTGARDKELRILERIHPVARYLASDIHGFRRRYQRLLLFLFIVILLLIAAGIFVVYVDNIPLSYSCVCGTVIVIWMFYVWSSLRLERPKESRFGA